MDVTVKIGVSADQRLPPKSKLFYAIPCSESRETSSIHKECGYFGPTALAQHVGPISMDNFGIGPFRAKERLKNQDRAQTATFGRQEN